MLLQMVVTQVNRQATAWWCPVAWRTCLVATRQQRPWTMQARGILGPSCCCEIGQRHHGAVVRSRRRNWEHLPSLIVFQVFKTSIHPYESKLLWNYFWCEIIPECVLFTDSCMKVRLVLLWLFCLRWHGCTFPSYYSVKTVCLKKKKTKLKKEIVAWFCKSFR